MGLDHPKVENENLFVFDGDQLIILDLSYNLLAELPEGIFGQLTSSESLNLNDNLFQELPEGIFDQLTRLEYV